jgi:hypothetical protein
MQGLTARRVLSGRNSLIAQRWFSQVAHKENPLQENDLSLPKMPPFDYSPPPYNGPSAGEILAKRKAYLNPALLHFYNKAVSPRRTRSFLILIFVVFRELITSIILDYQRSCGSRFFG